MTTPTAPAYASRADRFTSFDAADIPVPRGREEEWRFTPMRRIKHLFDLPGYSGDAIVAVAAPEEVRVETVARDDARLGKVIAPSDRTSVVAWNAFNEATVVTVPRGVELAEPVIITVTAPAGLTAGHLVIKAEPLSKAVVVVNHQGPADLNQTVEVRADDGANLQVVAVHEWDATAVHATNHRVSVGRDASLTHLVVTLGGDLVRCSVESEFTGPGGELHLNGIYFADAGQHLEHRVFAHHAEPDCFSRVAYKGALQGKNARSVWIGDCLIGSRADNTDTYELNRNLLLTEGAKADSVPNLEIENGEIAGAGHASAIGRFDDEQLFYLMSRGISEIDARRLVVRGFFAELINQIPVEGLRSHLMDAVEAELAVTEELGSPVIGFSPAATPKSAAEPVLAAQSTPSTRA